MAAAVAEAAPQGQFAHGPAPEPQENKGKAKSRRAQRLAAIKVPPVVLHTRTSSSGSEVTMTYERLHELGKVRLRGRRRNRHQQWRRPEWP